MKKLRNICLLIVLVFALTAMTVHRFYVAIYQINFVAQKKMVQVTTRIFVDDLNEALKNGCHKKTFIGTEKETQEDKLLMEKYLADKFKISVNGKHRTMNYLSYELENNVIVCYFNIKDVVKITSLEVENSILTELYPEQQNIIQFNNNGVKQNLLLSSETTKGMLK
jgi:hypothetical protein